MFTLIHVMGRTSGLSKGSEYHLFFFFLYFVVHLRTSVLQKDTYLSKVVSIFLK